MIIVHTDTNNKIWLGAAGLGLLIVYFTMTTAHRLSVKPSESNSDRATFSYEMPKSAEAEPSFDLTGREILRTNLGEEIVTQNPIKPGPFSWVKPKTKADKKKVDAKKPAVADAKKAKQQAAARKAAEEARRKKLSVNTIGTTRKKGFTDNGRIASAPTASTPAISYLAGPPATTEPTDEEADTKKEEEQLALSPSAWRALLQVQPTEANVQKFVKALSKNKVDKKFFYQVAKELLSDSAPDRRKAGLSLLRLTPSSETYEFLVKKKTELPQDVQADITKEFNRYSAAANLGVLSKVLATSADKILIQAALGQLQLGIEAFKRNQNFVQSEGKKSDPNAPTLSQLNGFQSALAKLGKNPDAELASSAKELTASITSLKK